MKKLMLPAAAASFTHLVWIDGKFNPEHVQSVDVIFELVVFFLLYIYKCWLSKKVGFFNIKTSIYLLLLDRYPFIHLLIIQKRLLILSQKKNNQNVVNAPLSTVEDSSSDSENEFGELWDNNRLMREIQDFLNLGSGSGSDEVFSKDYTQPEMNIKTVLQEIKDQKELGDVDILIIIDQNN